MGAERSEDLTDRRISRLVAFGTSAAIWSVGLDVAGSDGFLGATAGAVAAFLFIGAVVAGWSEAWLGWLAVLWVVGLGLYVAYGVSQMAEGDPYNWLPYGLLTPVIFFAIYMTLAFGAWVATAGALWVALEGGSSRHY